MTRFLLVRHGETDWNTEGRVQGGGHLNTQGQAQVDALAHRLKDVDSIAALLTSPTDRTLETANVLAQVLGLPVESHDGLRDLDYGVWGEATLQKARKADPNLFSRWAKAPHTVRFPNGDSLSDLRDRVLALVKGIQKRFPDGRVLLVTHDSPIRVVVCYALAMDDSHHLHVKASVGSLTIVDLSQESSALVTLNDTAHLRGSHGRP